MLPGSKSDITLHPVDTTVYYPVMLNSLAERGNLYAKVPSPHVMSILNLGFTPEQIFDKMLAKLDAGHPRNWYGVDLVVLKPEYADDNYRVTFSPGVQSYVSKPGQSFTIWTPQNTEVMTVTA